MTVESLPKPWIQALLVLHLQVPAQSKPPAPTPLPQVPALKRTGPDLQCHWAELSALDHPLPALPYLLLLWARCQNPGGIVGGSSSALGGCGRADRAEHALAGHGDHVSSWPTQGPLPLLLMPASPNSPALACSLCRQCGLSVSSGRVIQNTASLQQQGGVLGVDKFPHSEAKVHSRGPQGERHFMSPLLEAGKVEPGNPVIIVPPRREAMPPGESRAEDSRAESGT